MSKGNNYSTPVTGAQIAAAETAITGLHDALSFIPKISPDLLTTATISSERLPLADLAVKMATVGTDAMRKSTDPVALAGKLVAYRQLNGLSTSLNIIQTAIQNALNVIGSDILFAVNNIHEDVEKDKGETFDFGDSRREMNAYYAKGKGGSGNKPKE